MNMLRLRVRSEFHPRTKNGQPAQSTTGVARTNCNQFDQLGATSMSRPGEMHAHFESDDRARERQADQEASSHVGQALGSAPLRW